MSGSFGVALTAAMLLCTGAVHARESGDDLRILLDRILVTADRSSQRVADTAAAVHVISGKDLRQQPGRNLADILASTPGLAFLSFDGLGEQTTPVIRGFYGGGETGYVQVLVDGRPVNDPDTGMVPWDLIPLDAIDSVEIVRGGASALYGDTAIGGVVHIITRGNAHQAASAFAGSFGQLGAEVVIQRPVGERDFSFHGRASSHEGFRDHAARDAISAGTGLVLIEESSGRLHLSSQHYFSDAEIPGPLPATRAAENHRASLPFFRFDQARETRHSLTLQGQRQPSASQSLHFIISGTQRETDTVRTLPLSPFFADTQQLELSVSEISSSVQWTLWPVADQRDHELTVGAGVSGARLHSDYSLLLRGPETVYLESPVPAPTRLTSTRSTRHTAGAFAQYQWRPLSSLRLLGGMRGDWVRDEADLGHDRSADGSHSAFSGRIAGNWRYLETDRQQGNAYVTVGRSFKAPTPVQLFDQRLIPTGAGDIVLSNTNLKPQTARSVELGLYHHFFLRQAISGSISAAAYDIDLEDEIDFDLRTFSFANIGRSEHRGVELGLLLQVGDLHLFANYTRQDAVDARSNNQLKAVPRDVYGLGLRYPSATGFNASAVVRSVRDMFLDDANTLELEDYTTVDARLAWRVGELELSAAVFNLLDRTYSSTGFALDFARNDGSFGRAVYLYPAAGRSLQLAIERVF